MLVEDNTPPPNVIVAPRQVDELPQDNISGGAGLVDEPPAPPLDEAEPESGAEQVGEPSDAAAAAAADASQQNTSASVAATALAADAGEQMQCFSLEDILAARPSRLVGIVFGINYSVIFVFGLAGNIITLYVLLLKGSKCAVQDILIANLACSDIMLCLFAVPITPKYLIRDGHWTLGAALCKVVSFAQSTSVYMSTYSLICIGYIRYRLIIYPLGETMSKRTALLGCLGTWLVGLIVTLPYMLQVRLSPDDCPIKFCDEAWEKPHRFIFSLFTAFFQFMIPLASVAFFNKKIYSRLDGRLDSKKATAAAAAAAAATSSCASNSAAAREQHTSALASLKVARQREKERRMRKANNRLIFVVVIFAHSWLPLNLFNLAQDYFESMSQWAYLTNTFLIAHQIACSSVCWNPILYAWMSESYRQDLRRALPRCLADRFKWLKSEGGAGQGAASTNNNLHQLHHHHYHLHATQLSHVSAAGGQLVGPAAMAGAGNRLQPSGAGAADASGASYASDADDDAAAAGQADAPLELV